ncbi:MAG: hypothetical protein LDL12_07075 [Anaerolinea sp.]|nr:hypothetical protein [Anaerolinea sp.]
MKRAVSISIGSGRRDKVLQMQLLGQTIQLERRGTNGDLAEAERMFGELDGMVDAFGLGGTDLGLRVADRWYPMYSTARVVRRVQRTPVVDGTGLKVVLENRAPRLIEEQLGVSLRGKRVFVLTAVDRWGLSHAFVQAGCDCVFGDLLFSLGLPFVLRSEAAIQNLARVMMPVVLRLPFHWIYPTGSAQEKRTPAYQRYFEQADIIAGDCHYLRRYMPERLPGKILVTNTTTEEDRAFFAAAGVRALVTTTPVIEGRSFGTNVMEAALIACVGRSQPVDYAHADDYFDFLAQLLDQARIAPQVQELS